MIASPFGDVFLQSPDGPYWVLSLLDGSFEQCASSAAELQEVLDTEDGQDDFLLGGLAMAAWRAGHVPGSDEVLAFKIPPVLGGTFKVENIEVMDFVVIANLSGQLHRQLDGVPPGTAISELRIANTTD